jgi:hypothetical protein
VQVIEKINFGLISGPNDNSCYEQDLP